MRNIIISVFVIFFTFISFSLANTVSSSDQVATNNNDSNQANKVMHWTWDMDLDWINDCEKEWICDDTQNYFEARTFNSKENFLETHWEYCTFASDGCNNIQINDWEAWASTMMYCEDIYWENWQEKWTCLTHINEDNKEKLEHEKYVKANISDLINEDPVLWWTWYVVDIERLSDKKMKVYSEDGHITNETTLNIDTMYEDKNLNEKEQTENNNIWVCPMDMKQCPDWNWVWRTWPNCKFDCSEVEPNKIEEENNENNNLEEGGTGEMGWNMVMCTMQYDPVCWIDWKTYSNSCVAKQQNNVEIAYKWECNANNPETENFMNTENFVDYDKLQEYQNKYPNLWDILKNISINKLESAYDKLSKMIETTKKQRIARYIQTRRITAYYFLQNIIENEINKR